MKKIFILLCIFFISTISPCLSKNKCSYHFSVNKPIIYKIDINGTIAYKYEGINPETFKISLRTNLTLKPTKVTEKTFDIEIVPRKTFIQLNDFVLEDITRSETMVSQLIPSVKIVMNKNGKIIHSNEISPGMINILHILNMLPVFPDTQLFYGKKWEQKISPFQIPGIPMCNLKFWYFYEGTKKNIARFRFIPDQIIKEKRKKENMIIVFNGKNTSSGIFTFNEEKGEIENFKGDFDINLRITFSTPTTTPPLSLDVKLKFSFKPVIAND